MAITFYNSLGRKKMEFVPRHPGRVSMYNCGPTVYDYAHIGNFRAFLFVDVLRRHLENRGFEVRQVMNITDVGHMVADADGGEDKMEAALKKESKKGGNCQRFSDPWELAKFYTAAFFEDAHALNLQPAHVYPKATDHIEEMLVIVRALLDKGLAYRGEDGAVYYDVAKFPGYGKLSGNTLAELEAGAGGRVEDNPAKRNPFDFALWKCDPRHIMKWPSEFGEGFPGWHIECSAMAARHLGDEIDIHTGGEDNIFPHHECEIAQSEGANGGEYVRFWMHTRYLQVDGQKMSKSLGNFYTLRDLVAKGFDPIAIRFGLVSAHYRQPMNFTLEGVAAGWKVVLRLRDFAGELKTLATESSGTADDPGDEPARAGWDAALDDDLNISRALAVLHDWMRDVKKLALSRTGAQKALETLRYFDHVLGVVEVAANVAELPDAEIEQLIAERNVARREKNFARSDEIRDVLKERGIVLEDRPDGVRWRRAARI